MRHVYHQSSVILRSDLYALNVTQDSVLFKSNTVAVEHDAKLILNRPEGSDEIVPVWRFYELLLLSGQGDDIE